MQSARESHASLGNACKNISKTILAYDADANKLKTSTEEYLNRKLTLEIEEWDDIEDLLAQCTEVKEDLISTFDACLA